MARLASEGGKSAFGSGHNDDNDGDVEANLTKRAAVSLPNGFRLSPSSRVSKATGRVVGG